MGGGRVLAAVGEMLSVVEASNDEGRVTYIDS